MRKPLRVLSTLLACCVLWISSSMAAGTYEDIPMGSLSADSVKTALQKTLSPTGRFAILATNGTVRVFDSPDKIAQARQAIEALKNAPSIVSFAISIRTGMHQVTQGPAPGPVQSYSEVPVPQNYSPPTVIVQGGKRMVVPGMPQNFTPEYVDSGDRPYVRGYVRQGGYVSGEVVNMETTSMEGGVTRNFAGTTVFPKPVAVAVSANVTDVGGLREWAVKNGAAPAGDPAWTSARTEIVVTPEHGDDGVMLNLLPQIVATGADSATRSYPVRVCATSAMVKQGTPVKFEGFPGADPDFYRLFMGADVSVPDTLTAITVAGGMRYVGQPGDK